jgi:hypothetical protein
MWIADLYVLLRILFALTQAHLLIRDLKNLTKNKLAIFNKK